MEGPSASPEGDGEIESSVQGGAEGKKNSGAPWSQTARVNVETEADGRDGSAGSPVIRLLVLGGHAVGKSGNSYNIAMSLEMRHTAMKNTHNFGSFTASYLSQLSNKKKFYC